MPQWLELVAKFAPVILTMVPGVPAAVAPYVSAGIQLAETIPGATGAQKLNVAKQIVDVGVKALNAAKPGTIDGQAVNEAVDAGITAVVKAVNAAHSVVGSQPTA